MASDACNRLWKVEDEKELTDIPIVPHDQLRKFLAGELELIRGEEYRDFRNGAIAEITRLQTKSQIQVIQMQERQLEAQGRQIDAQTAVARSLRNATWVLVVATVLLAIATLVPWIWPRKPEAAPHQFPIKLRISPPPFAVPPP